MPASETIRLVLNPLFAESLNGNSAMLRVIYFDDHAGAFTVNACGRQFSIRMKGSGKFEVAEFPLEPPTFAANGQDADIEVNNPSPAEITLHMIEVARGD